jgi:hypothetical protein
MLLWTIQISIISIILIFLVHHLIVFFKNTLTVPKVKDLVNAPIQKYEDMYEIIHSSKKDEINIPSRRDTEEDGTSIYSLDELIPKMQQHETPLSLPNEQLKSMKDELKFFLKKQMNVDNTKVDSAFSFNNESNYSLY